MMKKSESKQEYIRLESVDVDSPETYHKRCKKGTDSQVRCGIDSCSSSDEQNASDVLQGNTDLHVRRSNTNSQGGSSTSLQNSPQNEDLNSPKKQRRPKYEERNPNIYTKSHQRRPDHLEINPNVYAKGPQSGDKNHNEHSIHPKTQNVKEGEDIPRLHRGDVLRNLQLRDKTVNQR